MEEKEDKYFEMLHPEYDTLEPGERFRTIRDKSFIFDNLDQIDREFQNAIRYAERNGEEVDKHAILKDVVKEIKGDKYFELLYPEYDTLEPGERFRTIRDKSFIFDNLDQIDREFQDAIRAAERNGEEVDKHAILKDVVKEIKGDKYFEILHPEYDTLEPGERFRTIRDKSFIFDNLDQIDREFQDAIRAAERNGEEVDKHNIIRNIVEGLKTKELTTRQIGKATINVPTAAKVEAEQVENGEKTKDNVKEGEEVGDDN